MSDAWYNRHLTLNPRALTTAYSPSSPSSSLDTLTARGAIEGAIEKNSVSDLRLHNLKNPTIMCRIWMCSSTAVDLFVFFYSITTCLCGIDEGREDQILRWQPCNE